MAEGAVYVDVTGNSVDYGIATLNTSGDDNPGTGETSDRYWLHWSYDATGNGGFSGQSWYWNDSRNYLDNAWNDWRIQNGYSDLKYEKEDGFKLYLAEVHPENLDHLFSIWSSTYGSKADFAMYLQDIHGWWPTGCVELT